MYYRIEHHLLNMYVITKYLFRLRKHQYLKRSIYFCVKLLLTCLPLPLFLFSLFFFEVAAAAAVLHASSGSGATFSFE